MPRFEDAARTVGAMLDRTAGQFPRRPALMIDGRTRTYAELRTETDDLAAGLLAAGISPGERVCLFAPNLAEAYIALIATAKIGAVFVPVNPRLTPRELSYALTASGAVALLFAAKWRGIDYVERLQGLWPGLGEDDGPIHFGDIRLLVTLAGDVRGATRYEQLLQQGRAPEWQTRRAVTEHAVAGTDSVFLQFTSGTTSQPKGVLLAQQPTARMSHELAGRFELTEQDRYFGCPPICHVGGTTFSFLAVLSAGAAFVTLPVFEAQDALALIEHERCTVVHGIDTHLNLLTSSPAFDARRLSTLRLVSVSGVEQTVRAVDAAFPGAVTISQYGSTELGGGPICAGARDSADQRLGSVGRPLPDIEVVATDPDSGAELPTGETGEIRVGGWSRMIGYLDQPEATAELFDDKDRLRTGDLGYVDDAGCVHFAGRLKNMLRTGGENVSVEEVESVLGGYPGVTLAVVVGVPDPRLGEVGYAFLITDGEPETVDVDDVYQMCRAEMATYKVPRHFEVCGPDRLATTASGKIKRAELQAVAGAALERADGSRPA